MISAYSRNSNASARPNMRYRQTKSPSKLRGQVLTPHNLADCLVGQLRGTQQAWLELGVGTGRIAQACIQGRDPESYIGVEIDPRLAALAPSDERLHVTMADVLSPASLFKTLGDQLFDRTAGNPPFGLYALDENCRNRIEALCPGLELSLNWVPLDLYFVLESISRLKAGGEAAFIVASPIAEDARLRAFRKALIETACEVECFELPERAFDWKAQVQTYLLVARFGNAPCRRVRVGRLSLGSLEVATECWVDPAAAIEHLDFGFHEFTAMNRSFKALPNTRSLGELGAHIVRGSRTKAQFDELDIRSFHTTDLPRSSSEVHFDNATDHGFKFAQEGDILIARVGTRCLDRQAVVVAGRRHYTEAVYRIEVPRQHQKRVASWVASEAGARWRRAAATGSCAKHLTVGTLMNMPVPR